eukprot:m.21332 g.21332  ORF g.21332 m.21332 type:complete len:225 (-) comp10703_c0_seq1:69-743(-)
MGFFKRKTLFGVKLGGRSRSNAGRAGKQEQPAATAAEKEDQQQLLQPTASRQQDERAMPVISRPCPVPREMVAADPKLRAQSASTLAAVAHTSTATLNTLSNNPNPRLLGDHDDAAVTAAVAAATIGGTVAPAGPPSSSGTTASLGTDNTGASALQVRLTRKSLQCFTVQPFSLLEKMARWATDLVIGEPPEEPSDMGAPALQCSPMPPSYQEYVDRRIRNTPV